MSTWSEEGGALFVTVTGGSGSGKSAFAEEQILKFPEKNRLYIATMVCFDEESRQRLKRHRKMRKEKHFDTPECPTDLVHVRIPKDTAVLLECMSNLAANEVFSPEGAKEHAYEAICDGILHLKEQAADVCVVTNEIFSDGMVYDKETENYQRLLGRINAYLAEISDVCYEVVYGIPLRIK